MATITISLPDGLVDNLDRIARHLGMSRSALLASRLQGTIRKDMVDLINSYVDDETDDDRELVADVAAISRRSISTSS
jgi:metal-responsive CopG/Arc/MetJ family transcriptional regulator